MKRVNKIAIIGGGISGLAAGIWGQKQGFQTVIFDKNSAPGGFCAGWKAGVQQVGFCFRGLIGTKENTALNHLWRETGALGNTLIIEPESFLSVSENDRSITLWQDLERFEREAKKLSTEDAPTISMFCSAIRTVAEYEIPAQKPDELLGPLERLKAGNKEAEKLLQKASEVSMKQFVNEFRNPVLRRLFSSVQPQNGTLALFLFQYAMFVSGNCGLPVGGAAALARRMAEQYQRLGGVLRLNATVEQILTANGAARGIELHSGERYFSHWTIAACDPDVTIHHLIPPHTELDKNFQQRYEDRLHNPIFTGFYCAFRTNQDPGLMLHMQDFEVDPFSIGKTLVNRLCLIQSSYDSQLGQNGNAQFVCLIPQAEESYNYWEELSQNEVLYEAETNKIMKKVLEQLRKKFPELDLKPVCCAAPDFFSRRFGAYHGTWSPFITLPGTKYQPVPFMVPGVRRLLLSGQWMHAEGGLHAALIEGRFSIQRICHKERLPFSE